MSVKCLFFAVNKHPNSSLSFMNVAVTFFDADWLIAFKFFGPKVKPSLDVVLFFCGLVITKPVVLSTFTNGNSEKYWKNIVRFAFLGFDIYISLHLHSWVQNLNYLLKDSQTACCKSSVDINGRKMVSASLSTHSLWWYLFINTVS